MTNKRHDQINSNAQLVSFQKNEHFDNDIVEYNTNDVVNSNNCISDIISCVNPIIAIMNKFAKGIIQCSNEETILIIDEHMQQLNTNMNKNQYDRSTIVATNYLILNFAYSILKEKDIDINNANINSYKLFQIPLDNGLQLSEIIEKCLSQHSEHLEIAKLCNYLTCLDFGAIKPEYKERLNYVLKNSGAFEVENTKFSNANTTQKKQNHLLKVCLVMAVTLFGIDHWYGIQEQQKIYVQQLTKSY